MAKHLGETMVRMYREGEKTVLGTKIREVAMLVVFVRNICAWNMLFYTVMTVLVISIIIKID